MQINEYWRDPSLSYSHLNPCKESLMFDKTVLDRLWIPNTCFINSKEAEIHKSPFVNVFLMIYPNGSVWVNYRIQLKGPCAMNLQAFPFDVQFCRLTFESYNYNTKEVRMKWRKKDDWTFELPDFKLVRVLYNSVERVSKAITPHFQMTVPIRFHFKKHFYRKPTMNINL